MKQEACEAKIGKLFELSELLGGFKANNSDIVVIPATECMDQQPVLNVPIEVTSIHKKQKP